MDKLSNELDQYLLDLVWSLWTELGVAGVKRKHQMFLIDLEELILLTVVLSEVDYRLRDETLDWCSQYHHLLSTSRLKSIIKDFEKFEKLYEPFSKYSATLNSISRANWPNFLNLSPLKFLPSHKSCLRPLASPALLNIRARSIFCTGARADLVTFFLTHDKPDFSASDLTEIGYSKRNLSEILEQFSLSGLFDKFQLKNQLRYRLAKNEQLIKILYPIPEFVPSWRHILEIFLPLRDCLRRIENSSESTRTVEIRNFLISKENILQRLNLTPPPFQNNYEAYFNSFREWILEIARKLAQADFPDRFYLKTHH